MEQKSDYAIISEDWIEMMKPMIKKRLEWAVDRISDFDILWTECKHDEKPGIDSFEQKQCSLSLVKQYFINKYL